MSGVKQPNYIAQRKAICDSCDKKTLKPVTDEEMCSESNVLLEHSLKVLSEKCPLGKWDAVIVNIEDYLNAMQERHPGVNFKKPDT